MGEFLQYESYRQLPKALMETICNHVTLYSAVLLRRNGSGVWEQAGSGTYVQKHGEYGILTAGHVIEYIRGSQSLGLAVMRDEHMFQIEISLLDLTQRCDSEADGILPDLGFIGIPADSVGAIRAREKTFYNYDENLDRAVGVYDDLHLGVWLLWGTASELTKREQSNREVGEVIVFNSLASFTGVEELQEINGYDAIGASVNYNDCSNGVPRSFKGYSGCGLWNIRLKKTESGNVLPQEYLLAGVACHQSDVTDGFRTITCHGPRGIDRLFKAHEL